MHIILKSILHGEGATCTYMYVYMYMCTHTGSMCTMPGRMHIRYHMTHGIVKCTIVHHNFTKLKKTNREREF